jgi:hypothetical protein
MKGGKDVDLRTRGWSMTVLPTATELVFNIVVCAVHGGGLSGDGAPNLCTNPPGSLGEIHAQRGTRDRKPPIARLEDLMDIGSFGRSNRPPRRVKMTLRLVEVYLSQTMLGVS